MMNLRDIKHSIRALRSKDLVKLKVWLHTLIEVGELERRKHRVSNQRQILETGQATHKSYRLESVRCGKKGCKCVDGNLHGPYWYAYWTEKGKTRSQYIGKRLPKGIKRVGDAKASGVR
jgi:hypothetical protein